MKYGAMWLFAFVLAGDLNDARAQSSAPVTIESPKRLGTIPQPASDQIAAQTPDQTATEKPAAEPPPLKPEDPLRVQVKQAVEYTRMRYLDAKVHTPWQIIHGVLALRRDYEIKLDGDKTNALEWIQKGQTFRGLPWVEKTRFGGHFHRYTQPWHFEGHPNQFLAILTMSDLPTDLTFQGHGGKVTIADMIEDAKATVNDKEEITWTLWALSKYLPSNAEWRNQHGEFWSMDRLIQIQTAADPNDAACGGTHGLFALCRARHFREAENKPLTGVWMESDQKIKRYISTARALQYSDGTFSCNYFINQQYKRAFADRLAPTGHTLEFLMVALRDEQLDEEWVRKGVDAVSKDLIANRNVAVDCGPLYHALSGLVLYLERTEPKPALIVDVDAQKPVTPVQPPKELPVEEGPLVAPKPDLAPQSALSVPSGE